MLNVQKDESLHSFIYRTHVVNGVSDFSNIITAKGGWASLPRILKNTLHLYEPIDDARFLYLLRDIGLANITDKTFEDPVAYREDLENFFGKHNNKKRNKSNTLPIKYCLKCIKKHIQDFGYGIINVTWSNNSFCQIHKTDLYIARSKSRNETIDALSYIFRGTHPKTYEKPRYRSEYFYDFREYNHDKKCDYIAPCLANEFKNFISDNFKDFSLDLLGQSHSSVNYLTTNHMMTKIYESAKNSKYKQFIDFWSNFAEITHLDTGVINRKAITEDIYKSKKVNCQNCKHLGCFSNLAIIPTRPDERLPKRCELDHRILLAYLKYTGVYNHDECIQTIIKMSTKQKFKALFKFQGDLFYRSYKVAIDNAKYAYAEPYLRWPEVSRE